MKTRIIMLLTAIVFISLSGNITAQDKKESKKKNAKQEVLFDVSMTCENCKKRIEKEVSFTNGVSDMKVDLPAKTVWIEYNADKVSTEKLQKNMEDLGYEVTIHKKGKDVELKKR